MNILSRYNIIGVSIFAIGIVIQSTLNLTVLTYIINPFIIALTNPYMIVVWDSILGNIPKNKFFSKYFFCLITCFFIEFLMWNITKPITLQADVRNGLGFIYVILFVCFLAFIIQYLIAFNSAKKKSKLFKILLLLIIPIIIFSPAMLILLLTFAYGLSGS